MSCTCGWSCFHISESWMRFCRSTGRDQWNTGAFRWKDGSETVLTVTIHDRNMNVIGFSGCFDLTVDAVIQLYTIDLEFIHLPHSRCVDLRPAGETKRWALAPLAAVWNAKKLQRGQTKTASKGHSHWLFGGPGLNFIRGHLLSCFHLESGAKCPVAPTGGKRVLWVLWSLWGHDEPKVLSSAKVKV